MIKKNFTLVFFTSIFLIGCSQKNNIIDLDISKLPKPKIINKENKESNEAQNKKFIKDLVPFENKEKVLSKFKFGKKDPFSRSEFQVNKLTSNLKLTGFLNTKLEEYAFVTYLGNEGTISEDSIGGLNTQLLPNGAKVTDIDSKAMKLTINYENENFVFEL
jgi:hypothetical protein